MTKHEKKVLEALNTIVSPQNDVEQTPDESAGNDCPPENVVETERIA